MNGLLYQNQSPDSCVVRCELYTSLTDFIRNHPNPVFMCYLIAGWKIQRPVLHRGPWRCRTEPCCDPPPRSVKCQSHPGPLSTRSTRPSHQGNDGMGRGHSDGGAIVNSCCGRSSAGGCQANTSTWSPAVQQATQRKVLLRGLHCRLPAGPSCHWHSSAAWDLR